jgi:hypothetical protein
MASSCKQQHRNSRQAFSCSSTTSCCCYHVEVVLLSCRAAVSAHTASSCKHLQDAVLAQQRHMFIRKVWWLVHT